MPVLEPGYEGGQSWCFALGHGWESPGNAAPTLRTKTIASVLTTLDSAPTDDPFEVAKGVLAYRSPDDATPGATVERWSANVPIPAKQSYLDRLSTYLVNSALIAKEVQQLVVEGERLGAGVPLCGLSSGELMFGFVECAVAEHGVEDIAASSG